ncbi:MAG: ribonuclease HI family protein [Candidatus Omnitrophota bacterium]|nr:MAG: ribonuclease HI family protein [Candidatus Omnitrophota bacterium]
MQAKECFIYIDGAARGNPGEAGIGIVIKDGENRKIKQLYKYIGELSNNAAEYTALIYALQEALILGLREVAVYSDSELLVKQLNREYRVKNSNLKTYYEQFLHLKTGFDRLRIRQIKREENKEADRLANEAIDSRIDTSLKSN